MTKHGQLKLLVLTCFDRCERKPNKYVLMFVLSLKWGSSHRKERMKMMNISLKSWEPPTFVEFVPWKPMLGLRWGNIMHLATEMLQKKIHISGKRELLQFFVAVVSTNASKWPMYVCKCKLKYINCEIYVGKSLETNMPHLKIQPPGISRSALCRDIHQRGDQHLGWQTCQ